MTEKTLYIITEPSYVTSAWFSGSIKALYDTAGKNHLNIVQLEKIQDIADLPPCVRAVIIVSSSSDWTQYVINMLSTRNIKPLLIGAVPNKFGEAVSGIVINRGTVIEEMVHYFYSGGRRRIAMVGIRSASSNDVVKRDAFLSAGQYLGLGSSGDDVFYISNDIDDAVDAFLDKVSFYDGALCANDYIGTCLIKHAQHRGVHIPEDLWVSGFGNLLMGMCSSPSLTTTSIDYTEMGMQAINLWKILDRSDGIYQVTASVKCNLIIRGSTNNQESDANARLNIPHVVHEQKYSVGAVHSELQCLENCLRQCDELDYKIITALFEGSSYEAIEDNLYISHGTLRYRLKKMYVASGAEDKKAFLQLLSNYVPNVQSLSGLFAGSAKED